VTRASGANVAPDGVFEGEEAMSDTKSNAAIKPVGAAQGRQVLFYAPVGLLGGTFTCSRCGATAHQPDVLDHARDCDYRPPIAARR